MASDRKEFFRVGPKLEEMQQAKICSLGAECLAEPWESPRIPWLVDVHARVDVCVSSSLGSHSKGFFRLHLQRGKRPHNSATTPARRPRFFGECMQPEREIYDMESHNIIPTRTTPPHTHSIGGSLRSPPPYNSVQQAIIQSTPAADSCMPSQFARRPLLNQASHAGS